MHAIRRTSACIITLGELEATVTKYNSNGWVVTDVWFVDDKMRDLCLNAIYRAGIVTPEEQAEFSKTHTWKKQG